MFGSRLTKTNSEKSDWDIIVKLDNSCYTSEHCKGFLLDDLLPVSDLEQKIAFNEKFDHPFLDIFFYRPDGKLYQWMQPDNYEIKYPAILKVSFKGEILESYFNPLTNYEDKIKYDQIKFSLVGDDFILAKPDLSLIEVIFKR